MPNSDPEPEPTTASRDGAPCVVCADLVVEDASALCNNCGKPFHLILTNDGVGKDCGEVWLNEDFMALEFGCHNCLAPDAGDTSESDSAPSTRTKHTNTTARDIVRRKKR